MTKAIRVQDTERFWSKVDKSGGDTACWPWMMSVDKDGYGQYRLHGRRGRNLKAHRIAYQIANGSIDPELFVLHSCDNPPCCNPAHLRQGTHIENMSDMSLRGRSKKTGYPGTKNVKCVLTEHEVLVIFNRVTSGENPRLLGIEFGVARTTIEAIKLRKTWKHLLGST